MASPTGPPMTGDQLTQHRLKALEDQAVGSRETERRVDTIALSLASVEKTVTETQTELRAQNERTQASLARLHSRLDEVVRADAREEGRVEGRSEARRSTRAIVAWSVGSTIAFGGLVVAVLTLILK